MAEPTNQEIAHRYFEASARNDIPTLESLRHPHWQERWPATGELLPSSATYRAIHDNYPGGYPRFDGLQITGTGDQYVITPANTVLRLTGGGDLWIGEARLSYGDGSEWYVVKVLELRDGKVHRETDYWAPVGQPPPWRAALTEPLPRADEHDE
ncbi:MAG: hypothetical protein M3Y29_02425 [Chloroflexota bacterium]|nr:hypothetical protein [Chloroflexota bacterium]